MINFYPYQTQSLLNELLSDSFKTDKSYPPYNIYTNNDNSYLEVAATGFSKEDLEVYVDDGYLVISANSDTSDEKEYIHHGLAKRNFTKKFKILNNYKVGEITLQDGLLTIEMISTKPEKEILKIS